MGSLGDSVRQFSAAVEVENRAILVGTALAALGSIQFGSPLTAAPGQPVDEGILRASFQAAFPTQDRAEISTNAPHAQANEEGITDDGRPYIQRSPVGGRHSVELTIANISAIADDETAEVTGSR